MKIAKSASAPTNDSSLVHVHASRWSGEGKTQPTVETESPFTAYVRSKGVSACNVI